MKFEVEKSFVVSGVEGGRLEEKIVELEKSVIPADVCFFW